MFRVFGVTNSCLPAGRECVTMKLVMRLIKEISYIVLIIFLLCVTNFVITDSIRHSLQFYVLIIYGYYFL